MVCFLRSKSSAGSLRNTIKGTMALKHTGWLYGIRDSCELLFACSRLSDLRLDPHRLSDNIYVEGARQRVTDDRRRWVNHSATETKKIQQ